jgi:hypothetical protein
MAPFSEEQAVSGRRGKWSDPGVPHRGWVCIEIEDLGGPIQTCEMCETQQIRFAHHMQHDDYHQVLAVGCVCSGNMEQDVAAAQERDRLMRGRSSRRRRWLTRQWRLSQKGNEWLRADGYRITIHQYGQGWGATLASELSDEVLRNRRAYQTPDQAKLAAFDAITGILASRSSAP